MSNENVVLMWVSLIVFAVCVVIFCVVSVFIYPERKPK